MSSSCSQVHHLISIEIQQKYLLRFSFSLSVLTTLLSSSTTLLEFVSILIPFVVLESARFLFSLPYSLNFNSLICIDCYLVSFVCLSNTDFIF